MSGAGVALLGASALASLVTGLPLFVVLLTASTIGAGIVVLFDPLQASLLQALPQRIVSLLENDLLQAIPLFVFIGVLLDRLPVIAPVFKTARTMFRGGRGSLCLAVPIGALLAPMNGSVGGTVLAIHRSLAPELLHAGVPKNRTQALVAAVGTMGVMIPPSLILILLGDAMMGAHAIALNASHRVERVVNTQDVFHGAFAPALAFIVLSTAIAYWQLSQSPKPPGAAPLDVSGLSKSLISVGVLTAIFFMLGGVTLGYFYAVEAAAMGAAALFLAGLASRHLRLRDLLGLVEETMAVSGAFAALVIAATSFTLVLRCLGTDHLIGDLIERAPTPLLGLCASLALIAVSALAFDAIEIIYVIVPLVAPSVLERTPDAAWVAVLIIAILQFSFLLPPFGLAVLFVRARSGAASATLRDLVPALAPYLAAQVTIFLIVITFPAITHPERWFGQTPSATAEPIDAEKELRALAPPAVE